jgi:hypothetical protein
MNANDDQWIEVNVSDFTDAAIGKAILKYIDEGGIEDLVTEAKSRDIDMPSLEVRDIEKLHEFVTWICSKVPSVESGGETSVNTRESAG